METKTGTGKQSADDLRRRAIECRNADLVSQSASAVPLNAAASGAVPEAVDVLLPPAEKVILPDEIFYSSANSQLGKTRKWIWPGIAFALAVTLITGKWSLASTALLLAIMVSTGLLMDWLLRRQMVLNEAAVSLTREGIESRLFTGNNKHYAWRDIVGVSIESNQNVRLLQLQLDAAQGFQDRRSFWTGRNDARPSMSLAPFESGDQEKLFEAVRRRLRPSAAQPNAETEVNPLTEERVFQEQLKSFAPVPWGTYGLIVLNILVWIATVAQGASVTGASAEKLLLWGGNATSEFQKGDWWRLLTATFLHGGLMHVSMNMIGLASAGVTVERIYGHRLFLLIYLGSGLIGSALSLHFAAQRAVSVGASGAVFGVTGALLVGIFEHRRRLPKAFGKQMLSSLGIFIVYALIQGFSKQGIDNSAHIGGLLGGCALAYLLPERFNLEHYARQMRRRAVAGVLLAALATVALAVTAPPAVVDQKKLFAGQAAFARAMDGFQKVMKAIQEEREMVSAGKFSERESDDRSRTVLAPMLRPVVKDFAQASLPPGDKRDPLLIESRRLAALILESLEMESVYPDGGDKPAPADPVRSAAIEAEIKDIGQRLEIILNKLKEKRER